MTRSVRALLLVPAFGLLLAPVVSAQVAKGLLDPNVATEQDLAGLPSLTPAIVTALVAARPFDGIVAFNQFLLGQGLTQAQATAIYAKAFVHVNLNTATREEILLIPGAGNRMAREFPEYRPWKAWAQFDKEIGKYVGQQETDRLKQYVFIPVKLNAASDEDFLSIPGVGARMLREFKEYRPWKTKEQFEKEISKYVGPKETARLWRYMAIE
jgi:DNA uptake protein ComE-like DNA-binding protein